MDKSSKLLSVSSRPPLVAVARVNEDDLDSNPGCILWVIDNRPPFERSRLDRFSLGSPDELGRLLDTTALFEVLPFLDDDRGLSGSGCWGFGERGKDSIRREAKSNCSDKLTRMIHNAPLTTSLDDGTSSEDLCRE